ncbi:MAG: family 10 glycosylhydrolase [Betaproteobacteria bacterium]|nr:family 10 glycosylhydrolase [Betaproteobacteria bacterium]
MASSAKSSRDKGFEAFSAGKARQCLGLALTSLVLVLGSCTSVPTAPRDPGTADFPGVDMPPPAPREFRAAWVATVANIDWPSKRATTTEAQKAEAIQIIETARALGLNALIFQVRPAADALYASAIEPWSEYLTGEQGKLPDPYYDPLQFWIEESHKRGLELHAWFNPYRARHTSAKSRNAPNHIANTHPGVVKNYGTFQWMDPGEPFAAQRTLEVILDVVRRYDIDGAHIDDYFYPYPVNVPGSMPPVEVDFPDERPWTEFVSLGGVPDRAAWRRNNVNRLVEAIYAGIKKEKPWVRFGVSPFGLGKPERRPPDIRGFSQYDKLYADVELWLQKGWMDYLAPQLYWPIAQKEQAYEVLLDYWHRENTAGRHVFPGLFTSRITNPADAAERTWMPQEISDQIALTRLRKVPQGHIHFSAIALKENRRGINEVLKAERYNSDVVPPAAPWLSTVRPVVPTVSFNAAGGRESVRMDVTAPLPARLGLWLKQDDAWTFFAFPVEAGDGKPHAYSHEVVPPPGPKGGRLQAAVASAFDRYGTESLRVPVEIPRTGGSR